LNESQIQARPTQPQTSSKPGSALDKSEQADEWETVQMRVTAYCPCERCCGEYADGITACGHKIGPGDTFAAADRRYSFGTEMVVAGYNNGEPIKVLDRGGAIRGDRLDVFFHTHEAALQWGVKYVDVKVRQAKR
jgi:3D (Asp-Asp-Asp) domain-containing protein